MNIQEKIAGTAKISASGDTALFEGEIDMQNPSDFLNPFFEDIASQMTKTVRLDFTLLEYLNSSGIKCIVSFVLSRPDNSQVIFVVDNNKSWQKTSFEVIQSLDEENISIQEA